MRARQLAPAPTPGRGLQVAAFPVCAGSARTATMTWTRDLIGFGIRARDGQAGVGDCLSVGWV
jgi:hypothetical protein